RKCFNSKRTGLKMPKKIFLFRSWVPEWLEKITLFIVLLPSLVLFFLPMTNINAAAGNTGIETYDVLVSVVFVYAAYVSFFSLDRRFFQFLAATAYLSATALLQIVTSCLCCGTTAVSVPFGCGFIRSMASSMTVNLSLGLIFRPLRS